LFFYQSATLGPSVEAFSLARIMTRNKHNKDKKLHNSDEKLHNSNITNNGDPSDLQPISLDEPDLSWQKAVDLSPEDEVEGGSEIYHFTDEDGNIHSREFLAGRLLKYTSRLASVT
jgi:hypothetical protein